MVETIMVDKRDLFLSHATDEKPFVRALAARLAKENIGDRKISFWLDEAEIKGSIPGEINAGLEKSRLFAAIMSPSYFESRSGWTDAEWHAALHLDPDNRSTRFLPILSKNCPYIPILLRHFRWFDLRDDPSGREFKRLVEAIRGQNFVTSDRGRTIHSDGGMSLGSIVAERAPVLPTPDKINERLTCNLLPVLEQPHSVYTAQLSADVRRQFKTHVHKKGLIELIEKTAHSINLPARRIPPFRLSGDSISSFYKVDKPASIFRFVIPNRRCVERTPAQLSGDPDSRLILVSLLNMAVQTHAKSLGLLSSYEPGRGHRFFFPPGHGKVEKHINWKPSRKTARRTVTKPLRPNDPKTEWLHAGAYLDIVELAGRWFLKIRPTWLVTLDGRNPKSGPEVGRIVNKWTNRERNLSILYHIRFWTTILCAGQSTIGIRTPSGPLKIDSTPAQLELPFGIANDLIDPDSLLDVEAKLIAESEHELVKAAIEFLADEEWEIETEDETVTE